MKGTKHIIQNISKQWKEQNLSFQNIPKQWKEQTYHSQNIPN